MSAAIELKAEKREKAGKGVARAIRREGKIPAIVYGGKSDAQMVSVEKKRFLQEYVKAGFFSRVIELTFGNEKVKVLTKVVANNPVSDQPEHLDFVRIVPGTKVKAKVRLIYVNQDKSPGLKKGGVLNIVRRELELNCNPEKIPASVTIDLSGLSIGDSITLMMWFFLKKQKRQSEHVTSQLPQSLAAKLKKKQQQLLRQFLAHLLKLLLPLHLLPLLLLLRALLLLPLALLLLNQLLTRRRSNNYSIPCPVI